MKSRHLKSPIALMSIALVTVAVVGAIIRVTGKSVGNRAISSIGTFQVFRPGGFDPGMKLRLASTLYPNSPYFFESCPDSPTGKCAGTIPRGGGFYTLPGNEVEANWDRSRGACRINSDTPFTPIEGNANIQVQCPMHFYWGMDGQSPVATIVENTIHYKQVVGINNYHGLQLNVPMDEVINGVQVESYAGLGDDPKMRVPVEQLQTVEFDYRTKICFGDKWKDRYQWGRFPYYLSFHNSRLNKQFYLSIDLEQFFHPEAANPDKDISLSSYLQRQTDFPGNAQPGDPTYDDYFHTIYIDAKKFGIVPDTANPLLDRSTNCSLDLRTQPWKHVRIPVTETIKRLVQLGYLDSDRVAGAFYVGGIIAGTEHFGRAMSIIEVKNHSMRVLNQVPPSPVPTSEILPKGNFRLATEPGAIFASNGRATCRFTSLEHAGTMDEREVSVIYERAPKRMTSEGNCPNAEQFAEKNAIESSGIYPEGKFRVREDGMLGLYLSNGQDAFCQFRTPKEAGILGVNQVVTIYDRKPRAMRDDSFCSRSPNRNVGASPVPPVAIERGILGNAEHVQLQGEKTFVEGWACSSHLNASITVHLYLGGPTGQGRFLGSALADLGGEPAINAACGTSGSRHRFRIPIPEQVRREFMGQPVYVYGISSINGTGRLLDNSGRLTVK